MIQIAHFDSGPMNCTYFLGLVLRSLSSSAFKVKLLFCKNFLLIKNFCNGLIHDVLVGRSKKGWEILRNIYRF